jgi:hypothetical protein
MAQLSEESLYSPVAGYAKRKSYRWQATQLQFFEYRIDLYAFSRKHDSTVAVELKLRDWRRAIEQALVYQLCADFVWIALPATNIRRIETTLLMDNGIGLLSVHPELHRCRSVFHPMQSRVVRSHYRDDNISSLIGRAR